MQPDKMSKEQLQNARVKSGNKTYLYIFWVFVILLLVVAPVLNLIHPGVFENRLTIFIAIFLIGVAFYIKFLFPRLPGMHIAFFIAGLLLIEILGHWIESKYHFPPALLLTHVAVEILAMPLLFVFFARYYLRLEAKHNKAKKKPKRPNKS